MPPSEPTWWYEEGPHWQATLLAPFGWLFGKLAAARIRNRRPARSRLPVICVGNFTAGGSGKTPMALLIARLVAAEGWEPCFLSRGYGGSIRGPHLIDAAKDSAAEVGDEPLILAKHAPTVVSRDRRAGAAAIQARASAHGVIVMDDGLQNRSLAKDLTIALVNGRRGLGNGLVIPAGPLRAPLGEQIGLADLVVLTGGADVNPKLQNTLRALTLAPIISARAIASKGKDSFKKRRVLAYAGIANPERFYSMLEDLGTTIVERRVFPDHHRFSEEDARGLLETAGKLGVDLVTTEKDHARLSRLEGSRRELRERSDVLAIEMVVEGDDLQTLEGLVRRELGP